MDSWIKLYRKITENPLYFRRCSPVCKLGLTCLLSRIMMKVISMSVATKLKSNAGKLAKRKTLWQNAGGGHEERLCAFWMNFKKRADSTTKSKLINLISIVNYELYQCGSTTESTTDSTSNDTSNSTTDGLQIEQQTVHQTVQQSKTAKKRYNR